MPDANTVFNYGGDDFFVGGIEKWMPNSSGVPDVTSLAKLEAWLSRLSP